VWTENDDQYIERVLNERVRVVILVANQSVDYRIMYQRIGVIFVTRLQDVMTKSNVLITMYPTCMYCKP
jgi:hypothetical protein